LLYYILIFTLAIFLFTTHIHIIIFFHLFVGVMMDLDYYCWTDVLLMMILGFSEDYFENYFIFWVPKFVDLLLGSEFVAFE
jgi:hypothetical protein